MKSRMRRESHVWFCERLRGKFPRATRPRLLSRSGGRVIFADFSSRTPGKIFRKNSDSQPRTLFKQSLPIPHLIFGNAAHAMPLLCLCDFIFVLYFGLPAFIAGKRTILLSKKYSLDWRCWINQFFGIQFADMAFSWIYHYDHNTPCRTNITRAAVIK